MAYDKGLAALIRDDLGPLPGLSERRMFGGLCFLLDGHMLCGVHRDGVFYRTGTGAAPGALAIPGTRPMTMGGRVQGGCIDAGDDALGDDAARRRLLTLAFDFVRTLPAKSSPP